MALNRAADYVSSQAKNLTNLYVRAISSYALTLVEIDNMPANQLYEGLKRKANNKGNTLEKNTEKKLRKIKIALLRIRRKSMTCRYVFRKPYHHSFLGGS